MSKQETLTNNVKDLDEEFTEAMTEEVLERLVGRGILVPFIYADGTIKYRIASKLNRRRRD